VLSSVVARTEGDAAERGEASSNLHPLLVRRPEKKALYLLLTSDRGLCGSFNAQLSKTAERAWRQAQSEDREAGFYVVGRKGRDYLRRRGAPVRHVFSGVWEKLDIAQARLIAETILEPFKKGEVDAIYLVFSEFKSAMTQEVRVQPLLPVRSADVAKVTDRKADLAATEYLFEPDQQALLDRLVPMYLEISILRALYESQASELGARMTAMDAATKNAKDMIAGLTLQFNRARQAAITKELMEIIGGAEALKE
jgi:F-type H+-transporting ATPase subunit gamma